VASGGRGRLVCSSDILSGDGRFSPCDVQYFGSAASLHHSRKLLPNPRLLIRPRSMPSNTRLCWVLIGSNRPRVSAVSLLRQTKHRRLQVAWRRLRTSRAPHRRRLETPQFPGARAVEPCVRLADTRCVFSRDGRGRCACMDTNRHLGIMDVRPQCAHPAGTELLRSAAKHRPVPSFRAQSVPLTTSKQPNKA
jgi:hypothetical protein